MALDPVGPREREWGSRNAMGDSPGEACLTKGVGAGAEGGEGKEDMTRERERASFVILPAR